jgi:teichuronic acid biosynthesis glycosyltransferase TuaC
MKILTLTSLFPNREQPTHAIFVETRLRKLIASGQVTSRVVAPVPWFPFSDPSFGRYARYSRVPDKEIRAGLEIDYPRYLSIPKMGMTVAPFLYANAAKRRIAKILDEGFDFDLIDAHFFYPDGVAAAAIGKHFNKPVVITARGSDITKIGTFPLQRRMIRRAADQAAGVITVCNALRDELLTFGVSPEKVVSLRNGVDLEKFYPMDRDSIRKKLGVRGYTLITVGHLVPVKGHELIIEAMARLPKDVSLLIAGNGPERKKLERLSRTLKVSDRVTFLGVLPQEELTKYFSASDASVLASSREGWANVLLESMACGTPVVASNVWGTPEVVAAKEAGLLVSERTAEGFARAVMELRAAPPNRADTRAYAERFSWDDTTQGQLKLFRKILNK